MSREKRKREDKSTPAFLRDITTQAAQHQLSVQLNEFSVTKRRKVTTNTPSSSNEATAGHSADFSPMLQGETGPEICDIEDLAEQIRALAPLSSPASDPGTYLEAHTTTPASKSPQSPRSIN